MIGGARAGRSPCLGDVGLTYNPLPRDSGVLADKAPYAFTGTVKKVVFDLKPAIHEDERSRPMLAYWWHS